MYTKTAATFPKGIFWELILCRCGAVGALITDNGFGWIRMEVIISY